MNTGRRTVGIVVALAREAAVLGEDIPLGRLHWLGERSCVMVCGMGPQRARRGAQLLARHGATALVSFGTAAALAPELRAGDLLLPEEVVDESGQRFVTDAAWRERLSGLLLGALDTRPLLSTAEPLRSVQDKQAARERYDAAAADMESAAIGAAAAVRDVPFVVLRTVVDPANRRLPTAALAGVDEWGQARFPRMVSALVREPSGLFGLFALRRDFNRARIRLAAANGQVGKDFAGPSTQPAAA